MNKYLHTLIAVFLLAAAVCLAFAGKRTQKKQTYMAAQPLTLLPAYSDSIVLPPNIAPLGFTAADPRYKIVSVSFTGISSGRRGDTAIETGRVLFEPYPAKFEDKHVRQWHDLLSKTVNGFVRIDIMACLVDRPDSLLLFPPLRWLVADQPIDPYLVYRTSIYEDATYHHIVTEQRNIENFEIKPLLDNFLMNHNCMNCHACEGNNINNFVIHLRHTLSGTLLARDGELIKLKMPDSLPGLRFVYPSWHKGGDYIAFSTNHVYSQHFSMPRRKGIATVDTLGDIVVLDTKTLEVFSCDELCNDEYDDVFPCFSADGRRLFFCRAPARGTPAETQALKREHQWGLKRSTPADSLFFSDNKRIEEWMDVLDQHIEKVNALRTDLMQIDFDPETRRFSNLRTVARFSEMALSATMPFASPDGEYLIVSALPTTTFAVQTMGDFYKVYLHDSTPSGMVPRGVECGYRVEPVHSLNTVGSETFHTFSSNGHWMVFASNRETFGIPEIYVSHVNDGRFDKPFAIPQAETDFYARNLRAFLFPFLSTEPAKFDIQKTTEAAHSQGVEIKAVNLDRYKKLSPAITSGH